LGYVARITGSGEQFLQSDLAATCMWCRGKNGDKLSFARGMLLRRDPDCEKTGRTLREALEKIDATE
jgi:hypothetical protein